MAQKGSEIESDNGGIFQPPSNVCEFEPANNRTGNTSVNGTGSPVGGTNQEESIENAQPTNRKRKAEGTNNNKTPAKKFKRACKKWTPAEDITAYLPKVSTVGLTLRAVTLRALKNLDKENYFFSVSDIMYEITSPRRMYHHDVTQKNLLLQLKQLEEQGLVREHKGRYTLLPRPTLRSKKRMRQVK